MAFAVFESHPFFRKMTALLKIFVICFLEIISYDLFKHLKFNILNPRMIGYCINLFYFFCQSESE